MSKEINIITTIIMGWLIETKISFRNIHRNKLNSAVIIVSLAIGFACTNLIGSFIFRELQTDNFHKNSSQIYALSCDDPWENGQKMYHTRKGSAEYMKNNFSEVEDFCRVNNATSSKVVVNDEAYFDRPPIITASENFFRFFSFELLTNNSKTVLESKNNLAISDELAHKYFGRSDPVGKTIELAGRNKTETMVISGIFKKPSENTQFNFEMVRLLVDGDSRCYVQLSRNASPKNMEKLFDEEKVNIPIIHKGTPGAYYLTALQETYFDTNRRAITEASRDKADLWIALAIALIILGIASFNYLGLLNNTLNEKSREFAIRKVNGGTKWAFLMRMMAESSVSVGVSFVISILLMMWMAPFFNQLTGSKISALNVFEPISLLGFLSVVIFILLLSLLFIAYRIRSKVNVEALKPSYKLSGKRIQLPAFNILQLVASVILIVSSVVIMKQISYITNKPIGLDKEVIEVKIPGSYVEISSVFKEELEKDPSIAMISRTTASPVLEHFLILLNYKENGKEKQYSPSGFSGDEQYLSTLGINLIEGSNFTGNPAADKNKVLINESLAKLFPNRILIGTEMPGNEKHIISGIVKDFHYSNLKSFVEPAFIGFDANGSHLMIKASENMNQKARETIAAIWAKLIPDYPLNIESIGDRYDWMHSENQSYIKLIGTCCIISIFLSMIGLFAISYQNSQSRTKEIGIRKVNGAKVSEILAMLNKDFIKWVAIAFVIACPIAYYAMNKWLENFAYKTELSWWIFALAGVLALGIALLTVSWQSWRAATRNPVEALRYE